MTHLQFTTLDDRTLGSQVSCTVGSVDSYMFCSIPWKMDDFGGALGVSLTDIPSLIIYISARLSQDKSIQSLWKSLKSAPETDFKMKRYLLFSATDVIYVHPAVLPKPKYKVDLLFRCMPCMLQSSGTHVSHCNQRGGAGEMTHLDCFALSVTALPPSCYTPAASLIALTTKHI